MYCSSGTLTAQSCLNQLKCGDMEQSADRDRDEPSELADLAQHLGTKTHAREQVQGAMLDRAECPPHSFRGGTEASTGRYVCNQLQMVVHMHASAQEQLLSQAPQQSIWLLVFIIFPYPWLA